MMSANEQAAFKRGKLNKKVNLQKAARNNPVVENVLQQYIHGEGSYEEALEQCVTLLCEDNARMTNKITDLLAKSPARSAL